MRFLVAMDGSEKDAAIIAPAAKLAQATRAQVLLLSVFSPWVDTAFASAPTPEAQREEVRSQRQAYLEERARAFEGISVEVLVESERWPAGRGSEDIAEAIARVAREQGVDIVVVASKRAGGLRGLLLGSTAQELLSRSPCPVLVVRPE